MPRQSDDVESQLPSDSDYVIPPTDRRKLVVKLRVPSDSDYVIQPTDRCKLVVKLRIPLLPPLRR